MSLAGWINTLWMRRCASAARRFSRATHDMASAQRGLLQSMLAENFATDFGRCHGLHRTNSVAEYQARVPIRGYDELAPWIERICQGEPGVLTAQRVQLLEPTSGTTSAEKLIPYNTTLKRQFQAAIGAWIFDLFSQRPTVRQGKAYWSVSPAFGPRRKTAGGLPIGFDSDQAYLGGLQQLLARRVIVSPPAIDHLPAGDSFRYATLLHLLATDDLTLISVWSPTFLTGLLANLPAWSERLCDDLRRGTFRLPMPQQLAGPLCAALAPRPSPRRAAQLLALFRTCPAEQWPSAIWPRLQLISCWADASAGFYLPSLRRQFPEVEIQAKGLISTEAFVSFPSYELDNMPLAATAHFFEFVEADHDLRGGCGGRVRLAHELDVGGVYRVVVTTGGGLYRYDLGDLVRVTGFARQCPLLRFEGRAGGGSDLVGEKLAEPFVREAVARLLAGRELAPSFAMLTPAAGQPPNYRLYLQLPPSTDVPPDAVGWSVALDAELCANPYYRLAIALRQLAPAEVLFLDAAAPAAWRIYEDHCLAAGGRSGSIKPRVLDASGVLDLLLSPFLNTAQRAAPPATVPLLHPRPPLGRIGDDIRPTVTELPHAN